MKILLTGATGYIGSHLAEAICGKHEIYGLCRGKPEGETPFEPVLCDLTDDGFVKALPRGVDTICHFAQSRHYRHFPEKAGDMFNVSLRALFPFLYIVKVAHPACSFYTFSKKHYDSRRDFKKGTEKNV